MSDAAISFGSDDVFGLSDTLTTYGNANWVATSRSNDGRLTYAVVLGDNGDEIARDTGHDQRNDVSTTYRWNSTSGMGAALPKVGAVQNGYLITSVGVEASSDDFPTVTVSGHNHSVNAHDTLAQEPVVYSWPAGLQSALTGAYGAYDVLVASLSDSSASDASAVSTSVTFECDHVDIVGGDGDHLAGENHNGRLSLSVTYNGNPGAVDSDGTYSLVNYTVSRENTGFVTSTWNAELGVAQDT